MVEVGRSIAERIPAGNRLPKAMVRAGHQSWVRGDLIARDFADEDAEAAWICDRIEAMRGLAFNDTSDSEARGLSWSDFAVLFRSVAKDADPLVAEMRRAEHGQRFRVDARTTQRGGERRADRLDGVGGG